MCPDPPGKESVDHEEERLSKRKMEKRERKRRRKRGLEFRSTGNEER